LESELQNHGLVRAANATSADVILAHSGGCQLIDQPNALFVNPNTWPERNYFEKQWQKIVGEFHNQTPSNRVVASLFWNLVYTFSQFRYNVSLLRPYQLANRASFKSDLRCIIIRNDNDVWCTPDIERYYPNARVITLSGSHDDCWINPAKYVSSMLEQL